MDLQEVSTIFMSVSFTGLLPVKKIKLTRVIDERLMQITAAANQPPDFSPHSAFAGIGSEGYRTFIG
jgi:hypothetical protein